MPRASPLKQMLRALSVTELRAVRQEFCPRVTPYSEQDGKSDFVDSLRRSLDSSRDAGELTVEELMSFVRDELTTDRKRVTTKIRDAIEDIEISSNVGSGHSTQVRENWMCGEIFQVIRNKLHDSPYEVRVSEYFGKQEVDIYIKHQNKARSYAIEAKRMTNGGNADKVLSQVKRYHRKVPNLQRLFVLFVVERERDLPSEKEKHANLLKDVEEEDNTEVLLFPPDQLRFTPS